MLTLTEALLITIVLVLTIWVLTYKRFPPSFSHTRLWDCVDKNTGDVTSVKMQYDGKGEHGVGCQCSKCVNHEKDTLKENFEYFSECQDPTEVKQTLDGICDENDKFEYAIHEFGEPGMEFKDWVASQAVDAQVFKNHAEFVKDRFTDNNRLITGRTYSPDSHSSYDPIPWIGLRRPQAVPTCNPTQVPDLDYNLFESRPTFTWRSS